MPNESLRDDGHELRGRAMSGPGCREALPALLDALRSPWAQVREQAADALAELGDPVAEEPLLAALEDASSWSEEACQSRMYGEVQAAIGAVMDALGAVGTLRSLDTLCVLEPQVVPSECEGSIYGDRGLVTLAGRLGSAAFERVAAEVAVQRSRGRLEPRLVFAVAATKDTRAEPLCSRTSRPAAYAWR